MSDTVDLPDSFWSQPETARIVLSREATQKILGKYNARILALGHSWDIVASHKEAEMFLVTLVRSDAALRDLRKFSNALVRIMENSRQGYTVFQADQLLPSTEPPTKNRRGQAMSDLPFTYGPNSVVVEAFLVEIEAATPEQVEAMDEWLKLMWAEGNPWSLLDCAASVLRLVLDSHLGYAWDAVWVAVWRDDTEWSLQHYAMLALLAQHLITEEQFNTLYGPWASVMEQERSDD